jgi:hypothetical protein
VGDDANEAQRALVYLWFCDVMSIHVDLPQDAANATQRQEKDKRTTFFERKQRKKYPGGARGEWEYGGNGYLRV